MLVFVTVMLTFVEIVIIQVHKVEVKLWNRPLFIEAWIFIAFLVFFRINGVVIFRFIVHFQPFHHYLTLVNVEVTKMRS